MRKKIKAYVDQNEAEKLLKKYIDKKRKGSFEIVSVEEIHYPYYILNNIIKIKRAFGLKPKIIEHMYWVNSVTGEILRSKEMPEETEEIDSGKIIKAQLNINKCKKIASDNALKHATRFYKSFWVPEIEIEEKLHAYLSSWIFTLKFDEKGNQETLAVDSFSGAVTKVKEKIDFEKAKCV